MQKYFIYARKSSETEDRQVMSIEAQLAELKEFINKHLQDAVIVNEFTEARTAKEPGRPVFN
jgi:DNA invertase Pin-like site-specific DNA recombinase